MDLKNSHPQIIRQGWRCFLIPFFLINRPLIIIHFVPFACGAVPWFSFVVERCVDQFVDFVSLKRICLLNT